MGEIKPGWRRVKFGEVVRLNRETCKAPAAEGIERYIGLEHLEPGDLRVRAWGDVADGTTFTNRVRPGQVLFGKRRAYQRKVALADFDAVCSGDIYVFESANPEVLLPELLPFLCQTDAFFERAVGTSAGSLSPRTNWTSLASYEFALPPLEEQRRMLELLRASSQMLSAALEVVASARSALLSMLHLRFPVDSRDMRPLRSYCRNLITYGIVQAGPDTPGGIPYIRVSDMSTGRIDEKGLMRTSAVIAAKYSRSEVDEGDLVIALRGPIGLAAEVPPDLRGANLTQGTARVSVRHDLPRDFVRWALASPSVQRRIAALAKGSTFKEISLGGLRELPIPWKAPSEQAAIAEDLNALSSAFEFAVARHEEALAFSRHILNICI